MCNDHEYQSLPPHLQDKLKYLYDKYVVKNCSFALGVHDGCEHDPNRKHFKFPRR